ncbi:MAG: Uracil-DNA glycosylase [Clostridiales bacterium]|jgi:uracil-DNA glycosylase|nr:Uracil-DNA glycosylase [Clostridiales bacterium]
MSAISNDWLDALSPEFKKPYYKDLFLKITDEYAHNDVFPVQDDIFNAYHHTPLSEVKVVILGQDPYHDFNQSHGLCFSVKPGIKVPPSLVNIYKELNRDLDCYIPNNGYLEKWANQGVLLLNTVLTVRAHSPQSHAGIGWENFTDSTLKILNEQDSPIIFMLWGKPAQLKKRLLNNPKHLILESSHPSPLSVYRGFEGCRHFSRANIFLISKGIKPIDWQIENIV